MFKRLRTLRISLAAKCQLLFGAAVVLILAAALFVPWQRMEQLTEQLNERSARTLVDYAIDAHVDAVKSTATYPTTRPLRASPLAPFASQKCFGRMRNWPMIVGSSRLPFSSNENVTSRSPVFSAFTTFL